MTTNTTTASQPNAAPSERNAVQGSESARAIRRAVKYLKENGCTGPAADLEALLAAPALPEPAAAQDLHAALTKINAIRDSIIGLQKINWSEHIYPLVAALDEAGFEGMGYPEARANVGTLLERAVAAEDTLAATAAQPLAEVSAAQGVPIYQHQSKVDRIGLTHWVDCTRAIYETCPEVQRRIVFASPAAQAVPEGSASTFCETCQGFGELHGASCSACCPDTTREA